MSDRLDEADYRALAHFRHALRVFLRFSEQAARQAGLTPAQHQLLLAIRGWGGEGAPSISVVARLLQLRHHSVVELVARAGDAGLVVARTDPADRRRQLLYLTEVGYERLEELTRLHRAELRRFRTELGDVLQILDDPPAVETDRGPAGEGR